MLSPCRAAGSDSVAVPSAAVSVVASRVVSCVMLMRQGVLQCRVRVVKPAIRLSGGVRERVSACVQKGIREGSPSRLYISQ